MSAVVQVYVRQVYGRATIYPANEAGEKFADLLGVKTFNAQQLAKMQGLGFAVEQVLDPAARLARGAA